jgi:hypothetical protein
VVQLLVGYQALSAATKRRCIKLSEISTRNVPPFDDCSQRLLRTIEPKGWMKQYQNTLDKAHAMTDHHPGRRFHPWSLDQFKRSAKLIVRLTDMKLGTAHEVLARAYGFANFHEVQQYFAGGNRALPETIPELSEEERGRLEARIPDLILAYYGDSELCMHWELVRELRLFERPSLQTEALRNLLKEIGDRKEARPGAYPGPNDPVG